MVNKTIALVHPLIAEHGQLQMYEMLNAHNIDLSISHRQMRIGFRMSTEVVLQVLDGSADVAFIRMDVLDTLVSLGVITTADVASLKVLNPRNFSGFPHTCSTLMNADWSFSAPPTISRDEREMMRLALAAIPPGGAEATSALYYRWVAPESGTIVVQALNQLHQLHKYESYTLCPTPTDVFESFNCPEVLNGTVYFKLSYDLFQKSCAAQNLDCPDGFQCYCSPCRALPQNRYAIFLTSDPVEGSDIDLLLQRVVPDLTSGTAAMTLSAQTAEFFMVSKIT